MGMGMGPASGRGAETPSPASNGSTPRSTRLSGVIIAGLHFFFRGCEILTASTTDPNMMIRDLNTGKLIPLDQVKNFQHQFFS